MAISVRDKIFIKIAFLVSSQAHNILLSLNNFNFYEDIWLKLLV